MSKTIALNDCDSNPNPETIMTLEIEPCIYDKPQQSDIDSNDNEGCENGSIEEEPPKTNIIMLEIDLCISDENQSSVHPQSNVGSSDNEDYVNDCIEQELQKVEIDPCNGEECKATDNDPDEYESTSTCGNMVCCSSVYDDQHELHEGQTIMLEIHPDTSGRELGPRTIERLLTGRRIVDIGSLFQQIQDISSHSSTCNFEDLVLIKEIKKGFNSVFEFDCTCCGKTLRIETNPKKCPIGINEAAVLGINAIGLGMYHLEEFGAHLNLPTMSSKCYDNICKQQHKDWWNLAKKSALDALNEEIRLAREHNEVDSAGNALITIMCDGSWAKRSYGRNFTSLSGCAAIIGLRTRKIIYFDIRNKYCHTCTLAKKNKTEVREHTCNKNYSGPSSGMEADIIIAGFRECELLGARFNKFVADGDSNTYKVIRDLRIYKNPDVMVEKYECVNHLYRNFEKKLIDLAKAATFIKDARDFITSTLCNNICKGIRMATKHWRASDVEIIEKIYNLEKDIMNVPAHYFGSHENCSIYFCEKTTEEGSITVFELMKESKLLDEILNACQHFFANNAKSLLADLTTNDNESFNNNIAKYLAGKRINYSLGGGYKARVARAVVQYNSDGQSGWQYHSSKTDDPPEILLKMESYRKRKCAKSSEAKKLRPPKVRKFNNDSSSRKAYGDHCQVPDMEPTAFERAKERFLNKLKENQTKRESLERNSIGQRHTPLWFEIRQNLLTSSFFSRIVNSKKRTSFKSLLDDIMYKWTEFGNNAENKLQRVEQVKALNVFKTFYTEFLLEDCGIFIDSEICFLGASPFKLYGGFLLNIKCPLKEFGKSICEAMASLPFWKKLQGRTIVNRKSAWFIEMQGQLRVTKRDKVLLMVWFGNGIFKVVEIVRDDTFFDVEMKEKLSYFYNEVMLKELVDSRKSRFMELRAYDAELQSFM